MATEMTRFMPLETFDWDHNGEVDSKGKPRMSRYVGGESYRLTSPAQRKHVQQKVKKGKATLLP